MSLDYLSAAPTLLFGPWWGQPLGEYSDSGYFVETANIRLPSVGGFKVHITIDAGHADELARVVLPTLRLINVHHKIVVNLEAYETFNARVLGDDLPGKFITAYPGDSRARFDRLFDVLDPALFRLRQRGARPGPWPVNRQVTPRGPEARAGTSGLASFCEVRSYAVS